MLNVVGLAVIMFASSNLDDIAVLLSFFADSRCRLRHIVVGQYLGMGALVSISLIAALISRAFKPAQVGLLGFLPIAIGIKKLIDLRRRDAQRSRSQSGAGAVLSVAGVTLANGGDNIGIYTPVFATRSAADIATITATFAVLTAAWLGLAHGLVSHPTLGSPIRRYGSVVAPIVLIGLGLLILEEADSFALLANT